MFENIKILAFSEWQSYMYQKLKSTFKTLITFMFKQRTHSLEGLADVIAITGMNHRSHHDIIYAV